MIPAMPTNFQRHAQVRDYDSRKPKVAPRSSILPPSHGPRDVARSGFVMAVITVGFTAFLLRGLTSAWMLRLTTVTVTARENSRLAT